MAEIEPLYIWIVAIVIVAIAAIFLYLYLHKKRTTRPRLIAKESGFSWRQRFKILFSKDFEEGILEGLHQFLIQADIGVEATEMIISRLREKLASVDLNDEEKVYFELKNSIKSLLAGEALNVSPELKNPKTSPFVLLFMGVNGTGKTSSIGKLAAFYHSIGKSVLIVAADTFRAGAISQARLWAQRANAVCYSSVSGADPSSVVYKGLQKAVNERFDIVLIDTAGRMHNRANLMEELKKMLRTAKKVIPDAPHQKLLVVDANTGQNALSQVELFSGISKISSVVLTKLDGTAKGGMLICIKHKYGIPVSLMGVGERVHDLKFFDTKYYLNSLFGIL